MYDPNKIYQALLDAGNKWADKKAAFQLLDDMTKTYLADCIDRCEEGSMAAKTEKARLDPVYISHLEGLAKARREFLIAEVGYKSMQALSDHRRTEQSTRRAEANLGSTIT